MLRTKVKASSITNLTDARYFAAMGVEWLGFNLNSKDGEAVSPQLIRQIEEWVEGVQVVAEYGDEELNVVKSSLDDVIPNVVQLGGKANMEGIFELPPSIPVIKEIIIERETSLNFLEKLLEEMEDQVVAFSINFTANNITWQDLLNEKPFSVDGFKAITGAFPVILEMDFNAGSLRQCLTTFALEGISLKGGEEEKTGFKSFDELDELFDVLME